LAALAPALQRRLLRYAAAQLGGMLDFQSTEALRFLAIQGRAGQRLEMAQGLRAERTPREIRLTAEANSAGETAQEIPELTVPIPGEIVAAAFGVRLRIEIVAQATQENPPAIPARLATLRNWRPGDRVRLRHSSGPRKVKEVLERLRVTGSSRAVWPVLEVGGRIAWMRGVELEPEQGIEVVATDL
jgi:tRNA(Ile)-lysidine synthase